MDIPWLGDGLFEGGVRGEIGNGIVLHCLKRMELVIFGGLLKSRGVGETRSSA